MDKNEAIKIIRSNFPIGRKILCEALEILIPELKENEDEEIRKELLYYIQQEKNYLESQVKPENSPKLRFLIDSIAWLEKQGEHANFRNKIQIGDEVTRNEDGVLVNLSQFKRMVKQGEQKSAWSEEDEKMLNFLIDVLLGTPLARFIPIRREIIITWLESLKERVQPQPKQEWSEEDENGLGDALWAIEQARTITKDENDMGNLWYAENWLKSLKERMKGK